jgi:uncharacterized protein YgiM (DUF1202 family)
VVAGETGANVRSGPSTDNQIVGFLDPGDSAAVSGQYEGWFRIDFEGAPAWVSGTVVVASGAENVPVVDPSAPAEGAPTPGATAPATASLVAGPEGANVRAGPETTYAILGRLAPGDSAIITGRYEQWYQIDYQGAAAWIASWVVTATSAENAPEVPPPAGHTPAEPEPAATEPASVPAPSLSVEGYVIEGLPGPYAADAQVPFWFKVTNTGAVALEYRALGTWAEEANQLFEGPVSVAPNPPLTIDAGQTIEGTGTIRLTQQGTHSLWLYVVLADDSGVQLAGPVTVTVE